jgi:hypothetical protein
MKVITILERSEQLNEIFKLAQTTDLLLKLADGTKFYLAHVTNEQTFFVGDDEDFEQEIIATRRNEALMQFLDKRGARARSQRGTPIEQVRQQLGL